MATLNEEITNESEQSDFFHAYREVLPAIVRSRATWLFTTLFLVSNLYLVLAGRPKLLLLGLYSLVFLLLTFLIVIPLTAHHPTPTWEEPKSYPRIRLWWQLALVFAILAAVIVIAYQKLQGTLPLLEGILYFPLAVVIPLGGMWLLGASWRELGIGRGYHTWRVTLALILVPFVLMIVGIAIRKLSLTTFLTAPISMLITAGLPEEIIFRGVLMTRLTRVSNVEWGIVLSSLIFGLVHIGANPGYYHVNALAAAAIGITSDATLGIALALILQRTRSLAAGMIYHAFIDAAGFILLPFILLLVTQH